MIQIPATRIKTMSSSVETPNYPDKKAHPWRRCPMGKHFVREHSVRTSASKKNPNGSITIRHENQ